MEQAEQKTILIVEDDQGLRALIVKKLWQAGYQVAECSTGAEAIEQLRSNPDLVTLLDQKLPDMTGRDIIELLKAEEITFPFVIMTGQGDERLAVEMMKLGAADYLVKNLDLLELLPGAFQKLFHSLETERQLWAAEEEIKQQAGLIAVLLDSIPDIIFLKDINGVYKSCNSEFARHVGRSKDQIVGKTDYDLYPREEADAFRENDRRMIEIQSSRHNEEWITYPDGHRVLIDTVKTPYRDIDGNLVGILGISRDITERKQAENKILYMSFHDNLTDLYNRHYLEEEMKRLNVERQMPLSMIMADLNGLKLINDTYGHATGDQLLKRAAEILKKTCREEDIIARWGGDEFVILLPGTSENEAASISKRINNHCRKAYVKNVPVSIALGLATWKEIRADLSDMLKEAEDNMYKQKLTESRSTKSAVLKALLKTLAEKSFETDTHTHNMQELALRIGEKLGLPDSELRRLELLITLHDIGKINIPEEILVKKGPLNQAEWQLIRKHPETGYRIALATEEFAHVAEDILSHHERWDGMGYPRGLAAEKIPLLARITAVADAVEVMTNGRPYKPAMSLKEILDQLLSCAGSHFDPDVAKIAFNILPAAKKTNQV
ncbi:MAG: diguanylate cyclase [Dethiobacteria bacterium]|nr:diguanylate cyclase [Dethiobacteria bacterium]